MATSQTTSPPDLTTGLVVRRSDRKRTATAKVLAMQSMTTGTGTSKSKRAGPAAKKAKRATKTKRVVRAKVPTATPHVPPPIGEATGNSVPSCTDESEAAKTVADSPGSSPVSNHETTDLTVESPSEPSPTNVAEATDVANGANESSEQQASLASSELEAAAIEDLKVSFTIKNLARQAPHKSNGLIPASTWDKECPTDSESEQSPERGDGTNTVSEDLSSSLHDATTKTKAFAAIAEECDGTPEPEDPINITHDEETIQQNIKNEPVEAHAPESSKGISPTITDENKKAATKRKERAAAKPAEKAPAANTVKLPAETSRPVKSKATKGVTMNPPAASNASSEVVDKSSSTEKENIDANANVEEATVDTTTNATPKVSETKDAENLKVADGPSNSPPRKPLSGICPVPQPEAVDRGAASGSQPRKRARKPTSTVAAPTRRYNLRALKVADEELEEGPKRKRARY